MTVQSDPLTGLAGIVQLIEHLIATKGLLKLGA